uniref:Putative secreted protein n=1 Tax=Amblyomma americanum TaxID=6943 RepID=A0A0C9SFD6_AMBAM
MALFPKLICSLFIAGTLGNINSPKVDIYVRVDYDSKLEAMLKNGMTPQGYVKKLIKDVNKNFEDETFRTQNNVKFRATFHLRAGVPHEKNLIYNILKDESLNKITLQSAQRAFDLWGELWMKRQASALVMLLMPVVFAKEHNDILNKATVKGGACSPSYVTAVAADQTDTSIVNQTALNLLKLIQESDCLIILN